MKKNPKSKLKSRIIVASDLSEAHLLVAIIMRAFLDYHSKDKIIRRSARQWLNNVESIEPFSYFWCLDHLLDNPRSFMEMAKRLDYLVSPNL